ncbi:uncharacterized protein GGS22DRAFT_194528 [Annulohypoxylon maeteangense]|uniref:uncharacterized protein n=1 Tax=Annulohypoxylon maeteangense TaxID=1927788 RepID=UPI002007D92F|nr:uncharacterized protein GGS22DRAFT_194528 [Annulohypoxylon maeteangense]KAI0890509.1 hypothetical protein GGS22DRAFT_194528 [Annulohypoxylon maeteangense]
MNTTHAHQNTVGSGGPAVATSHQRTASISTLSTRQTNNTAPSSPESPNRSQIQSQGQTNLPQHFIVRPGVTKHTVSGTITTPGPIVPLVAVDQLPEWLDLFGVPRELSLEQTVGLSNLGTVVRSPEFYTVYMHSDLQPALGRKSQDYGRDGQLPRTQIQMRQGEHREDRNSVLLVPPDMSTSGPPSISSSTVSTPGSPLSSRMDPATKAVSSGNQPHTNDPDKRAAGGNNANIHTSPEQPPAMNLGIHQHLPSPTATGSTPQTNTNPYPILHPSYPHLHAPPYPPSHPHAPYPPPAPLPPIHPADRMLYSWTPPTRKSTSTSNPPNPPNPNSSSTRQKPSPNSTTNSSGNSNSIYCKHWCHRGTCRWGAQCRYAHTMPATPEGLREVGLSHHPAWWTAAFNMAYGSGGFGGWYPPPAPHPHAHPHHVVLSGKHYGGGGKKGRDGKGKEKEKEKIGEREGLGKGRVGDGDGNRGNAVVGGGGRGGGVEAGGRAEASRQLKKDVVEGKAGGQEQRKPEAPKEEPKLVEI